jgi:hypothetical protein
LGYGLDYDGLGRNLSDLYVLVEPWAASNELWAMNLLLTWELSDSNLIAHRSKLSKTLIFC